MADGARYRVDDARQIALGRTRLFVVTSGDRGHLLPLLTMTGITYLKARKK